MNARSHFSFRRLLDPFVNLARSRPFARRRGLEASIQDPMADLAEASRLPPIERRAALTGLARIYLRVSDRTGTQTYLTGSDLEERLLRLSDDDLRRYGRALHASLAACAELPYFQPNAQEVVVDEVFTQAVSLAQRLEPSHTLAFAELETRLVMAQGAPSPVGNLTDIAETLLHHPGIGAPLPSNYDLGLASLPLGMNAIERATAASHLTEALSAAGRLGSTSCGTN